MKPVTPLSRIPQPMKGMNWEPTPSDYTTVAPPPPKYGDTDFANDDFVALWNVDTQNPPVGRYDLQTIKNLGCNTIKMYNWSAPAPHYWQRNHVNFLAQAGQLGLSVIVPISNFFTGTAYNNRTTNGNAGGPASNASLSTWITAIVTEVYQNNVPGAAVMWAIGNEYDNSNVGAYGYCEAQDIAQIAAYIIAAEASLGIAAGDVLAFTSPVTTALGAGTVNTSIPTNVPPYNTLLGGCAIQALLEAFTAAGIPTGRFVASINSYQIGAQLTAYYTAFPKVFGSVPFFYGELGSYAIAPDSPAVQASNLASQFSTTMAQAAELKYFYGSCCFEFSDELWKGPYPAGSSETTFGIYTFPTTTPTESSVEGNHAPVWGATYPVDQFVARPAMQSLQTALQGNYAVSARRPWLKTGIQISASSQVSVGYVAGLWTADPKTNGGARYDAAGCPGLLVPTDQPLFPMVGVNMGALVGRVGDGGTAFLIGDGPTNVPTAQAGELQLIINDDWTGAYGAGLKDNEGLVTVQITGV